MQLEQDNVTIVVCPGTKTQSYRKLIVLISYFKRSVRPVGFRRLANINTMLNLFDREEDPTIF